MAMSNQDKPGRATDFATDFATEPARGWRMGAERHSGPEVEAHSQDAEESEADREQSRRMGPEVEAHAEEPNSDDDGPEVEAHRLS